MDELDALAAELVSIPSHEDPDDVGDEIAQWLRESTDGAVRRDEIGNVFARRGAVEASRADGASEQPVLALVGHHDVVPPDDSQVDPSGYVTERRNGRRYGRGSADMKGALAAAMLAFRDADLEGTSGHASSQEDGDAIGDAATAECDRPVGPSLVFASFVGEETGGAGARFAIDDGFAPDYAIVGEGSTGYSGARTTDVAVAHKGRRASTVVTHGESVHASVAERGTNAIYGACDAVEALRSLPVPSVDVWDETVSGSLVVTEIDGGTAWNVVPDRCSITVDERTVPGERLDLGDLADREGVTVTVDQDLPPMHCTDEAFAQLVLDAARTCHSADSGRPEAVTKPHATDAGWLADAGTACVVCGPAEPGEAHTADESVSIAALERCYCIYRSVAERIGSAMT